MKLKSLLGGRSKYGLLLGAVALLGGTAYFFSFDSDELPSEDALHGAEPGRQADRKESSETSEVVEFPRDMWETVGLQTAVVRKSEMIRAIQLTGKVSLNEDKLAHIFPLVEGRVDEVRVQFGERVKQGDLLVVVQSKEVGQGMLQLYQDRLKLEFAEYQRQWTEEVGKNTQTLIEMLRAGATVEEIEQALKDRTLGDYREKLMTAYVAYLKSQVRHASLSSLSSGVIPAREIVEAQSALNAAKATLQALLEQTSQDTVQASRLVHQTIQELKTSAAVTETNLKILGFEDRDLAEIDPAKQGEQLAHYPVIAPFDGTVISKDVVLLERVGPERQILTIADLSTVWVTADIYETHLPLLSQLENQTLVLSSDSWPGKRFEAKIFYTGDVVQESTRTIALRALARNEEGWLKPGMFVSIELPSLTTGEVLQVPSTAIQNYEGRSFVFVQTGEESFTRRDVTVGHRSSDTVEIRSGLEGKERIVVHGGFALKSQMLADLLAE